VGPGDEVIVPAFTYVSTAVVAVYVGATPVFADIDPRTLTISAATVERVLSPRTRAVMAVHYAGPAVDFGGVRELVAGRGVTVIEDAAHAFGSRQGGRLAGADAEFAAFSFAPTKQIASSNGGLLLFKDKDRRAELGQLAFLGLAADTYSRTVAQGVSPTQHVARIGHKYKIDDVAAAIAYAGVEELDAIVAHRAALAHRYYQALEGAPGVEMPARGGNDTVSWYVMPIRVPAVKRDGLRARLGAAGIDSTVHYPSLRDQPAFRDFPGEAEVAARESARIVSLPLHRSLELGEVDRIAALVRDHLG
jgi:dTDP-4-amino-4,6-dideoxygalactose transaminase